MIEENDSDVEELGKKYAYKNEMREARRTAKHESKIADE